MHAHRPSHPPWHQVMVWWSCHSHLPFSLTSNQGSLTSLALVSSTQNQAGPSAVISKMLSCAFLVILAASLTHLFGLLCRLCLRLSMSQPCMWLFRRWCPSMPLDVQLVGGWAGSKPWLSTLSVTGLNGLWTGVLWWTGGYLELTELTPAPWGLLFTFKNKLFNLYFQEDFYCFPLPVLFFFLFLFLALPQLSFPIKCLPSFQMKGLEIPLLLDQ